MNRCTRSRLQDKPQIVAEKCEPNEQEQVLSSASPPRIRAYVLGYTNKGVIAELLIKAVGMDAEPSPSNRLHRSLYFHFDGASSTGIEQMTSILCLMDFGHAPEVRAP